MPNNVWCDNEDCIYHEDGMCDIGDLAIDCNGCCMGSLREYEEYKRSKPVAETRRKNDELGEMYEKYSKAVAKGETWWAQYVAEHEANATLSELVREMLVHMRVGGCECCVYKAACDDDLLDECAKVTRFARRARDLGVEM